MRLLTVSDWSDNRHVHSLPVEDSIEMVVDSAQSIQRSVADSTPCHHTQHLVREDSIGTVACLKNALSAPRHPKQRLTREDTIGTVACLKNALSGPSAANTTDIGTEESARSAKHAQSDGGPCIAIV